MLASIERTCQLRPPRSTCLRQLDSISSVASGPGVVPGVPLAGVVGLAVEVVGVVAEVVVLDEHKQDMVVVVIGTSEVLGYRKAPWRDLVAPSA